jgi:hypothetical protein
LGAWCKFCNLQVVCHNWSNWQQIIITPTTNYVCVFFQVHSKPGKEYFQFAALPSLSQSISTPITNTTTPQEPPPPGHNNPWLFVPVFTISNTHSVKFFYSPFPIPIINIWKSGKYKWETWCFFYKNI